MIKINELRILNYLCFNDIESAVTAIDLDLDGLSNEIVADGKYKFLAIKSGKIKGIPITEEWLIDMGFKRSSKISDNIDKWVDDTGSLLLFFNGKYAGLITSLPKTIDILFVHQLQNIYFSMFGKEIKFKKRNLLSINGLLPG